MGDGVGARAAIAGGNRFHGWRYPPHCMINSGKTVIQPVHGRFQRCKLGFQMVAVERLRLGQGPWTSGQARMNDVAVHVRETEIASAKAKRETAMIDAE